MKHPLISRSVRLAALLLALVLAFPALAEAPVTEASAAFDAADWPETDERFFEKTWDEVASEFISAHGMNPDSVGLYYYNTVTGEEHDWNGDKYFTAASTYKVPINLIYADRVSHGEMTLDDTVSGVPLRNIQRGSLRNSSNELGEILIHDLGTYRQYKEAMTPYLCPPGESLDEHYIYANAFTPRQMGYSLKLLYADPDRFPEVLDHMLNAQPDGYFRLYERRYPIAHKYGYFVEDGFGACNDIGIAYTEEPIIIVMMTDFVGNGVIGLAHYAQLMCDYSQYGHARTLEAEARRLAEEQAAREAEEQAAREEAERLAEEERQRAEAERLAALEAERQTDAPQPTPSPETAGRLEAQRREAAARMRYVLAAALGALLVAALVFLKKIWRIAVPLVLAAAIAALLLLPAEGGARPEQTAAPSAPAETAEAAPTPSPSPTPEPTPEPVLEYTVTDEGPEAILALAEAHPELRSVNARQSTEYAALAELARLLPDCAVEYTVPLSDTVSVGSLERSLTLAAGDTTAEELSEKLAWLPRLERLDLTALDLGNAALGPVADAYPEKDIVWMVRFSHWTVRSDITVFSTLQPWPVGYRYTDQDLYPLLHWCRHLTALDLGHNDLRDLEPIGALTELQALIIGDNENLTDLTPLGNLVKLEYMELFLADKITDFSPLAKLENMVALCVGFCAGLDDISFIDHMPKLEMGWFARARLTEEQRQAAQEAHPDTRFLFFPSLVSSTSDGWRMTDRNVELRRAFSNWQNVVEFRAWDDVDYREGVTLNPVIPLHN